MFSRAVSMAFVAPVLVSGALLFTAGPAFAKGESSATLSGSNEVPPGDASLTGKATVTADDSGKVCATVTSNVKGAVAMHIHKGASGKNGPVVVPLDPKKINKGQNCVTAKADVAKAIGSSPADYYVNIHTPKAPGGAVRGQLAASSSSSSGSSGSSGSSSTPSGASAGSGGQAGDTGPNGILIAVVIVGVGVAGAAGWRLARR
jgi:hypothetical protein